MAIHFPLDNKCAPIKNPDEVVAEIHTRIIFGILISPTHYNDLIRD